MNITENILAAHSGRRKVIPGEIIEVDVDLILGNELSTIIAINEFEKAGIKKVFDKSKIVIVPDHFTPNKDIQTAQICKRIRNFVNTHQIEKYFEVGRGGIEHVLLPEKGLVIPGSIIIGGDSHTCTYGAFGAFATGVGSTDMAASFTTGKIWFKAPETIKISYSGRLQEWVSAKDVVLFTIGELGIDGATYKSILFTGNVISELDMAGRMTVANMAVEMGAKTGLMEADEKTIEFLKQASPTACAEMKIYSNDADAVFERDYSFELSSLEPQVAMPHSPHNVLPISKLDRIKIDQVLIGSCTNGRIEDLRIAARILRDKKVNKDVRLIVLPGSQMVVKQAVNEGIYNVFIDAGAAVSTPTCGACVGGHMGILAEGERCLSTTNRNFKGRMGHITSEIFLSSPAVAAASAVTGYISHPSEVV